MDAVRKIPWEFHANYKIQVDSTQDPYAEDIVVPQWYSADVSSDQKHRLIIEDQGSASGGTAGINVDSITHMGGVGLTNFIKFAPTSTVPYLNENPVYASIGGEELVLTDCGIAGTARNDPSQGMLCYGSVVKFQSTFDFGSDLVERGVWIKRGQQVIQDNAGAHTVSGSVTGKAAVVGAGEYAHNGKNPSAGSAPAVQNVNTSATIGAKKFIANNSDGGVQGFLRVDTNDVQRYLTQDGTEWLRIRDSIPDLLVQSYPMRFNTSGNGFGAANAEDLSGKTGNFDGEMRRDDGTNTSNPGLYCYWDSGGTQWVATDGSTFS
jgi:hypothetical protein